MNLKAIGNFALAGLFASAAIVCIREGIKTLRESPWPDAVHYVPSDNGAKPHTQADADADEAAEAGLEVERTVGSD